MIKWEKGAGDQQEDRCGLPLVGSPKAEAGHAGGTMSPHWSRNASGSPPGELDKVAGERKVRASLLRLQILKNTTQVNQCINALILIIDSTCESV